MRVDPSDARPSTAPLEQFERELIEEFLREHGHDRHSVLTLPPAERDKLLAAASTHASGRMTEVEARSHYLDDIHDRR